MNTERAEQLYKVYYFNEKDPFGIHSRSFYKIRDRFVLKTFAKEFRGNTKQMLDIASGPGTLMKKIHSAHQNLTITCSDMNPVALKFLKANTPFIILELKLPKLEEANNCFDIVSCFDTYYLLNEEDKIIALNRIFELLKNKGSCFIVDSDLSGLINLAQFREKEKVCYRTDKISKILYFSLEEKLRNKYYVLNEVYRNKLIEYKLLPEGYFPRLSTMFWVIYYLLYPLRILNKLLYSSVLVNNLFSFFGKEKYEIFVYERI